MHILAQMTQRETIGLIIAIAVLLVFSVVFTFIYRAFIKSSIKEINSGKRDIELIDDDLHSSQPKVIKRRKVFHIIRVVLFYLLIALLVPVMIISIISRINGNYFMIGNKGIVAVASGSMSEQHPINSYLINNNLNNQFNKYDLLQMEKVKEDDLKLYDIIIFENDEHDTIIHRIIKINDDGTYTTRGDSNPISDSYQPKYSDIYGRYTDKKAGGIGIVVLFLNSMIGVITIVAVIYGLLMLDYFGKKLRLERNKRENKLSIIFNPEKNHTVMSGNLYYQDCKYIYEDNKFVAKEEIVSGSMRKRASVNVIKEVPNEDLVEIEVDYFDPVFQD